MEIPNKNITKANVMKYSVGIQLRDSKTISAEELMKFKSELSS